MSNTHGILVGSTSQSRTVILGQLTGLVFNTSGLTATYLRQGSFPVEVELVTLASISAPWASGGFKEASQSLMPGVYRFDIPNAAFVAGADWVAFTITYTDPDGFIYGWTETLNLTSVAVSTPPSAGAIADAVWDENASLHATDGTTGDALLSASAAGDPLDNPVPGDYGSGTAGAALGRIGRAQIVLSQPVTLRGVIYIVRGASYYAADSRALEWTDEFSELKWPNLTGATVVWVSGDLEYEMSVVVATGNSKVVRLELSEEQSTAIAEDRANYTVMATLSNGHPVDLARSVVEAVNPNGVS